MNSKLSISSVMKYVVMLYAFIVTFSFSTGTIGVKIVRVLVVGMFFLYFITRTRKKGMNYLFIIWTGVFTLYNLFRCQFALDVDNALEFTMSLIYVTVVQIIVSFYLQDRDITQDIMKMLIIAGIFQALYLFCTEGFLVYLNSRSAGDKEINANSIGFNCALSCLFSLFFYKEKRGIKGRGKYLMFASLAFILMILTGSRKPVIILGIPLIISYLFCTKDAATMIGKIFLVAIGLMIAWEILMKVDFFYSLVGNRIESMIVGFSGGKTDASTATRMDLTEYGIGWWKDNPIWGYGMNNFTTLMKRDHPWQIAYYAHNNYIELLVDSGIVGTVLYYSMYVILLIRGFLLRGLKNLQTMMLWGVVIAYAINDYGMVSYSFATYQLLLLLCFNDFFVKNAHSEAVSYA